MDSPMTSPRSLASRMKIALRAFPKLAAWLGYNRLWDGLFKAAWFRSKATEPRKVRPRLEEMETRECPSVTLSTFEPQTVREGEALSAFYASAFDSLGNPVSLSADQFPSGIGMD